MLSAVGTYAIQNNPVDIYWMLGFGVLGYFLKMYGFQVGPVILGIILGPLMDSVVPAAMISTGDDPASFVGEFFTSPISAILTAALALTIVSQTALWEGLPGASPATGRRVECHPSHAHGPMRWRSRTRISALRPQPGGRAAFPRSRRGWDHGGRRNRARYT